jgi:hypothetical protein
MDLSRALLQKFLKFFAECYLTKRRETVRNGMQPRRSPAVMVETTMMR